VVNLTFVLDFKFPCSAGIVGVKSTSNIMLYINVEFLNFLYRYGGLGLSSDFLKKKGVLPFTCEIKRVKI